MTPRRSFGSGDRQPPVIRLFLPALTMLLAYTALLPGAVVVVSDSEEPLLGYAVERPNGWVVSSSNRSDAKTTLVPKDKVVEVIPTVSRERLANLSATDPEGCFRYADELFAMHRDPEARDTAIRLYLIAGRTAPEKFARGALLSLQRLAPNEKEKKRVAAFGITSQWISPDEVSPAKEAEAAKPPVPQELLRVLRPLKQGKKSAAARAWKVPAAVEQLQRYALQMTSEEMNEAVNADALNRRQLARIVALEVAIDEESEPSGKTADETLPWSGQLVRSKGAAIRPLGWEFLFEGIDPRDDQYSGGSWKKSE